MSTYVPHRTAAERMTELVRSFPILADFEEIEDGYGNPIGWGHALRGGWDPVKFDKWAATSPAMTDAARFAAQFVLMVWGGRAVHLSEDSKGRKSWKCPWKVGGFDLAWALKVWDLRQRDAFLAWARSPWWV